MILKENQRINHKRYELEKEKLALYQTNLQKKEIQRCEIKKLKLMNYEIKKKKFKLWKDNYYY